MGWQVVVTRLESGAARSGPVLVLRVIESELDALFPALLSQLANWIAVEWRVRDNIERICLGVEHGEAVMVLSCDHDVLHARRFRQRNNVVRAECRGIELRRER